MSFENTWLFQQDDIISKSPNRKYLSVTDEIRAKLGIQDFLIKLGTQLKLDAKTIFAATLYVNRFYTRVPITSSKYYVASAAIAILCKLHDNYRQVEKIALASCLIKSNGKKVTETSDVFWQWKDQLLYREELILRYLNFELNIDFPYQIRDELMDIDGDDFFNDHKKEVLFKTVSTIEVLSLLPVLLCYDMETVFAAVLVNSMILAREKFATPDAVLPANLCNVLKLDLSHCYKCYNWIVKLLLMCDLKDPRAGGISKLVATFSLVPFDTFAAIANAQE